VAGTYSTKFVGVDATKNAKCIEWSNEMEGAGEVAEREVLGALSMEGEVRSEKRGGAQGEE
jgi:hypothetical protein